MSERIFSTFVKPDSNGNCNEGSLKMKVQDTVNKTNVYACQTQCTTKGCTGYPYLKIGENNQLYDKDGTRVFNFDPNGGCQEGLYNINNIDGTNYCNIDCDQGKRSSSVSDCCQGSSLDSVCTMNTIYKNNPAQDIAPYDYTYDPSEKGKNNHLKILIFITILILIAIGIAIFFYIKSGKSVKNSSGKSVKNSSRGFMKKSSGNSVKK